MVTTPSGGQVLLDKGFYNITGLAWSGRGKIKRVDVSVDGGRNWRTARLEGAGADQGLTRFNIDWVWDGKPAYLQSRAIDETGYVQPTYRPAARGARHALDLSQQRDPVLAGAGKRRGEQCPAVRNATAIAAGRCWRSRVWCRASAPWPSAPLSPASAAPPRRQEIDGLGHRRAPRLQGLAQGRGHRWRRARTCGRPNARPATASSASPTRCSRRSSAAPPRTTSRPAASRACETTRRYPGRTTLMKVATLSTLWDYINRAMPWNAPKTLSTDEVYARDGLPAEPGRRACRTTSRCRDKNIAEVQSAAQPQRHDHRRTAVAGQDHGNGASPT